MLSQATNEIPEEKDPSGEYERKPSYERVLSSQMQGTGIDDINENNVYRLGFARKKIVGLAPFTHSAVAFKDLNAKANGHDKAEWLIFGRQTPFFLKSTSEEGRNYVGGITRLFQNLTNSKIANEKNYNFFPEHKFEVEKTTVVLSGREVKEILHKADEAICTNHSYDFNLVQSNCYSASVYVLACAIEVINNRTERNATEHANNDKSIAIIQELLAHATKDNFSVGVITHPVVLQHLAEVDRIITKRALSNLENNPLESNLSDDALTPKLSPKF